MKYIRNVIPKPMDEVPVVGRIILKLIKERGCGCKGSADPE
jgi:hypothetical protein